MKNEEPLTNETVRITLPRRRFLLRAGAGIGALTMLGAPLAAVLCAGCVSGSTPRTSHATQPATPSAAASARSAARFRRAKFSSPSNFTSDEALLLSDEQQ